MTFRVVFVTSHPIQYQVPVFRHLAVLEELEFSVLFAMLPDAAAQGAGFGVKFDWDVPLLEGYDFKVLDNVSSNPGVTRFLGCDTPGIFEELKALKPNAVIINGWVVKTCLQALWACKRLKIPCLVRGEANNLRRRPWWKRLLQTALVRRYDACLYIGKANKEFYEANGVGQDQLFFAPYCIENERFAGAARVMAPVRENLRGKWGIPVAATCFVFCGKFEDKKHPLALLQALANARQYYKDLFLLMVGDGKLRPQCEDLVTKAKLPVTFTGFLNQSEIIAAYVAADCLVLPSDAGETWGLVVNEAMACGLPAIVSDQVGCAVDLVHPGMTGDVFPCGDIAELANRLQRLGRDRAELNGMGAAARRHIGHYSPATAATGIRDAVRAVSTRTPAASLNLE